MLSETRFLPCRRGPRFAGAFVTALLGVLAVVLPASADRGCLGDPALTGRTCSEAECLALQANVNSACKSPAPTSCNSLSGCSVLRSEKQRWLGCAIARDTINARCWSGGDPGHQQASAQAWQNVGNCEARIALPEPVGCADPCPQIPGRSLVLSPTAGTRPSPPAEAALEILFAALGSLGYSNCPAAELAR